MAYLQIAIGLLLLPLISGTFSDYLSFGGPNILIIATWAFVWFTDKSTSLRWALIIGLMADVISFSFFGFWTLQLIVLVYLIAYLKHKYFSASSMIQAVLALVIMVCVSDIFGYLLTYQINGWYALTGIFTSATIGAAMYYLLAVRLHLFSRWAGRRLS